MTQTTQQAKTPQLRFKQADGTEYPDWQTKKLGDVFSRITDKNVEDNQNCLTISAQHGLINQLEFFSKKVSAKNLKGYYLLHKGDFAYNKSYSKGYPMGAIKRLKFYDKGVVSTLYICFRIKSEYNESYFEFFFDYGGINTGIEQIAQEGARNHGLLNVKINDFFEKVYFKVPHKDEQAKIANFLSAIDKRIELLQAKYDNLQKYKTGILQKIFTQQIRFKHPNGKKYPDWQSVPLEKLGKFSGAGVDKKTNENEPLVNLLNFMDIVRNKFLTSDITNHIVSAPEKKVHSCSVLKGDLILTPSSETREELAFSAVVMENMKNTVYSYHVLRFRFTKDIDLKFKAYMLENDHFRKQSYKMGEGSGQRYVISMKLFNKMEVFIPIDIDEQKQIAEFLSAIDAKITITKTQITATKSFKQGLLQQMFI